VEAIMRTLIVIAALLTPVPVLAQSTCPTTASSNRQQFIPPAPNRAVLERGRFWYGSDRLWTQPTHGVFNEDAGSLMMTALDLPGGCWQIEAQYANERPLTFVVAVP
jgi:hypothetical protein